MIQMTEPSFDGRRCTCCFSNHDIKEIHFNSENSAIIVALCGGCRVKLIKKLTADDGYIADVECPIYDQCEVYHGCTVQVLSNSVTGKTSVGWWHENDPPVKMG